MLDLDLQRELAAFLHGRVCIVGVGNRGRGDDGAGPGVIDACPEIASGAWLDAGMTLENHLGQIAESKPESVLIIDAVAFGGVAGECRLLDARALEAVVLTTHAGSLGMLSEYLEGRTGARVCVLAIQPENIKPREGLSDPVAQTVRELCLVLSDLLSAP